MHHRQDNQNLIKGLNLMHRILQGIKNSTWIINLHINEATRHGYFK